jgi:hypothetical protein
MHTTRALGPGAGLSWLIRAVQLGRHNARAVFGAVALLALVASVPQILQIVLESVFRLGPADSVMVAGVMVLLTMAIAPPMFGGVLRVIDAAEHGRDTHALAVFEGYRPDHAAGRMVTLGLLMGLLNLAMFLLVIWLFGDDLFAWFDKVQAASLEEDQAALQALVQAPPSGFRTVMMIGMFFGMFMGSVGAIAFGQVALADARVLPALRDGIVGTLKNALPILVMAAVAFVVMIPFVIVCALVLLLLGTIGALIGASFAMLLMLPAYLGMVLALYVVVFGVMYYLWRDVCGVPDEATRDPGVIVL